MLTKSDLKGIDTIVSKRIKVEVKPIIKEEVRLAIKEEVRPIIKEELKSVKEDIIYIRKDMKVMTKFFDTEYLQLRKRVERLEDHLNLSPLTTF